jgi:hypothetical protein
VVYWLIIRMRLTTYRCGHDASNTWGLSGILADGRSINHISLKICKERSDWIILPKLTNQNNSIIRTLK